MDEDSEAQRAKWATLRPVLLFWNLVLSCNAATITFLLSMLPFRAHLHDHSSLVNHLFLISCMFLSRANKVLMKSSLCLFCITKDSLPSHIYNSYKLTQPPIQMSCSFLLLFDSYSDFFVNYQWYFSCQERTVDWMARGGHLNCHRRCLSFSKPWQTLHKTLKVTIFSQRVKRRR